MKKVLGLIILSIILSCNNEKKENSIEVKTWVYLETEDSDGDAIYGEITQEHLNWVKENTNSDKLMMISNARYIDVKDSLVKDFSINGNEKGTFFYKIKNISYIEMLLEDPINTKVNVKE